MQKTEKHHIHPLKVFHLVSNPGIGGIEGMLSELIPKIDKNRCDMRVVNMRSEPKAYQLWDKIAEKTAVHIERMCKNVR